MLIISIMSYNTFLILFYLIFKILYLLITFIQLSLTKPPSSGNQKSNLFFCLFVWSIIDLQHYVSFFLHGIVIQYFYTFWTDKHQKSSYDMPSYKHIM